MASALATSATALFAARAGQGLGAAMLSPAALSIIMATFTEGHERARALGAWGAVGGAGAAVGVLLGGALTSLIGWQAIFLINVPVGLVLGAATMTSSPPTPPSPMAGLEPCGAALATGSLGAIVFALSQATAPAGPRSDPLNRRGRVLGLIAFAVVEMHTTSRCCRSSASPTRRRRRLRDDAAA